MSRHRLRQHVGARKSVPVACVARPAQSLEPAPTGRPSAMGMGSSLTGSFVDRDLRSRRSMIGSASMCRHSPACVFDAIVFVPAASIFSLSEVSVRNARSISLRISAPSR